MTLIQFRDDQWNAADEDAQQDHITETEVTAFSGFGLFGAECEGYTRAVQTFKARVTVMPTYTFDVPKYGYHREQGPVSLAFDPSCDTDDVSFTGKETVWVCEQPYGSNIARCDSSFHGKVLLLDRPPNPEKPHHNLLYWIWTGGDGPNSQTSQASRVIRD